jgi:hypothetical protein
MMTPAQFSTAIVPRSATAGSGGAAAEETLAFPRVLARLVDVSQAPASRGPADCLADGSPRATEIRPMPAGLGPSWKLTVGAAAVILLALLVFARRNRTQPAPLPRESPPAWNGQAGHEGEGGAGPAQVAPPPGSTVPADTAVGGWPTHGHGPALDGVVPRGEEAADDEAPVRQARRPSAPRFDGDEPTVSERSPDSLEARERRSPAPPDLPTRWRGSTNPPRTADPFPRVEYNRFVVPASEERTSGSDQSSRQPNRPAGAPRGPAFPARVSHHDDARKVFH